MWKEQYYNLLFSKNKEDCNFAKAMILKSENIPPLYKYRAVNEYTLSNLKDDLVWCSRADTFNDPFDSGVTKNISVHHEQTKNLLIREFCASFKLDYQDMLHITKSLNLDRTQQRLIDMLKDVGIEIPTSFIEKMHEWVQSTLDGTIDLFDNHLEKMNELFQKSVYASCFSEEPLSILMWSHYADNNKGICLEYNFSNLELPSYLTYDIHPVRYTDSIIDLTLYENTTHIRKALLASLNKSKDWEYEKEWRIAVDYSDNKDLGFPYEVTKPVSIIMGSRIRDSDKKLVLDIAKDKGIAVKQVKEDKLNRKLYIIDDDY
ncbi:hypothetical protein ABE61_06250 [Lysinibacillus sphaericus]|uniref:DUF2971 domain-containing protein n=1 Tax=Lysinibacillus sphaericus TaxID=1421 RepID=UPI0018CC8BA2|nr:DUF2971 domain-containing protein [Lysinibacillus sphaericus]MBG9453698.1 hypothetical protein [Lysinibacillus sphaericus]MBG9476169.1 hypothetical protein [Lysinibacillus sphaericus]MBG9591583.1 hypothetical protein [Lysinibacillus sphaericus]